MTNPSDKPNVQTIRVRNRQAAPQVLTLEPWGDVHELAPGAVIEVIASGPEGGVLEVECGKNEVIVHGWPHSVAEVRPSGAS